VKGPSMTCVVCTRNRKPFLQAAVASLLEQDTDPACFEILVVDNGSNDGSTGMLAAEFGHEARVRVVSEPEPGLSRARNMGWREARGAYVAFLDDDAVAAPCWVSSILRAFADVIPRPGCVGGPIDLMWEAGVPDWIPFDFYSSLGFWYLGEQARIIGKSECIAGGNMALPKTVLQEVDGFDVRLGRSRWGLMSNEEILLEHRIRHRGYDCYYDPAIRIKHWAHASRLRPGWFLSRMFWQGVSDAVTGLSLAPMPFRKRCAAVAGHLREVRFRPRSIVGLVLTFGMKKRVSNNGNAMWALGYLLGNARMPRL
jgi:glycosyltransferase involved in cell wall biosynthesis